MNQFNNEYSEVRHDEQPYTGKPKWVRYTLISLGVICSLLLLGALIVIMWLGPILEKNIEKNDKQYIGKEVSMDNLSVNLFSGEIYADDIVIYGDDDVTPYILIDQVNLEIKVGKLMDNHLYITKATIVRPQKRGYYLSNPRALRVDLDNISRRYIESLFENRGWKVTIDKVRVVK